MRLQSFTLWPQGQRADVAQSGEDRRAEVLLSYGFERIAGDAELDQIVRFTAALCETPISLVSIVERKRQWFPVGVGLDVQETPRPTSFCAHTMLGDDILEIRDATRDPRFAGNDLVTGEPHIRFYAGAPLVSGEGVPIGALCVIDHTARPEGLTAMQRQGLVVLSRAVLQRLTTERMNRSASDALDEADRRLLQLAEHLPVFAWSADADGTIDYGNIAFFDYVGTRDLAKINLAALAHPDDRDELVATRAAQGAKGERWEGRARIRGADGQYRWMMLRSWPLRDRHDGEITSWFGAAIDIDEIHRLSESRDVLARELSHRIKNIFAVVSGLVSLRSRGRDELRAFSSELNEVLHALGRAHDYVRPLEGRKGDSLRELLRDLLKPYQIAGEERIRIDGADVPLGARAATPLALVFHELATNSAKYGALSDRGGHVAIVIQRDGPDVIAQWNETVALSTLREEPPGDGFGTRLLTMAVERQLGGRLTRSFTDQGLEVLLRIPESAIGA